MSIDLDRPCIRKRASGTHSPIISMYKDDPGRFFAENGAEVDMQAASAAGFDVDAQMLRAARARRAKELEAQLDGEIAELKRKRQQTEISRHDYETEMARLSRPPGEPAPGTAAGGGQAPAAVPASEPTLKHVGFGKWQILMPDGTYGLPEHTTKEEAQAALDELKGLAAGNAA